MRPNISPECLNYLPQLPSRHHFLEIAGNSWLEGIQLVQRKLLGILDGMNVKLIEAVGEPFDPMFHEAIMQEPTDEYESGTVSKELQKGYQIGDRVIRPSLVYVAE